MRAISNWIAPPPFWVQIWTTVWAPELLESSLQLWRRLARDTSLYRLNPLRFMSWICLSVIMVKLDYFGLVVLSLAKKIINTLPCRVCVKTGRGGKFVIWAERSQWSSAKGERGNNEWVFKVSANIEGPKMTFESKFCTRRYNNHTL